MFYPIPWPRFNNRSELNAQSVGLVGIVSTRCGNRLAFL